MGTALDEQKSTGSNRLTRAEIRRILRRHYGAMASVAKELGVRRQTVQQWTSGRAISARIAEACERRAIALLEQERLKAGAA